MALTINVFSNFIAYSKKYNSCFVESYIILLISHNLLKFYNSYLKK